MKAWRLTLVNCSPNAPRGIFRAPAKNFAKQKDLWGKEEPTLSAWHSPSGGCPQKASCSDVVPPTGLEPIRLPAQDPKSCASANFATAAYTPPLAGRRAILCLGTQFSSGPFGSGSPPSAGALSCSVSFEVSSASVLASSAFSTGAGVPSGAAYACVLTVRS